MAVLSQLALMQVFEKAMNAAGPPPAPAPDLPDKLPYLDPTSKGTADRDTDVPSLKDLGYADFARTPFRVIMFKHSLYAAPVSLDTFAECEVICLS